MDQEIQQYKSALKKAINKINDLNNRLKQYEKDEIAIIGYSCRFPGGANSPEEFWRLLKNGYDAVDKIPNSRFEVEKYYSQDINSQGTMYTQNAALLNTNIKEFDNVHFEITAVEAASIDPQHRLLLEVSWEALENSGLDVLGLKGSKTGAFIGISSFEYIRAEIAAEDVNKITPYSLFGMAPTSAAGRLSYFYDFKGPAVAFDTACSSSLVALNAAVESLRSRQCDLAIVGGVNLILCPHTFIGLSQLKALSPDGRCKVFDDAADGFGRGEGCGIVVLKRIDDAEKDDNCIEAVIKSSFIGQDGRANGYYAPNGLAEEEVLFNALNRAGLSVDDVDYIEAHGTGTQLGDHIEMQSIKNVYANRKSSILIGSVKSNVGHLEAAAGMASLIKVLLSIKHGMLPPSLYCNSGLKMDGSLEVVTRVTPWRKSHDRRRAGISCFGISGTLAHAIIEEPEREDGSNLQTIPFSIITLSSKNKATLRMDIEKLMDEISKVDSSLIDIAYSTNIQRSHLPYRFAVVGDTKERIISTLNNSLDKEDYLEFNSNQVLNNRKQHIAFVFSGQGSIYKDIAKQLYNSSSVFFDTFTECENLFKEYLGISISKAIYEYEEEKILHPLYSQPVVFTVEYALCKLWNHIGIYPDVVIGHSIGEYGAACCAGLITLENAVRMIVARAKLMEAIDMEGKMVGVLADETTVVQTLLQYNNQEVSIAAINAPNNVTISGKKAAVDSFVEYLQQQEKVFVNDLHINRPYHSSLLSEYEIKYEKEFPDFDFQKLRTKMISSVTGKFEQESILGTKKYWSGLLSKTVKFKPAVEEAWKAGVRVFIEIGGTATLCGLSNQCIGNNAGVFVPTLRKGQEPYKQWLESIKILYLHGVGIRWSKLHSEFLKENIELPPVQFRKKEFWKKLKY